MIFYSIFSDNCLCTEIIDFPKDIPCTLQRILQNLRKLDSILKETFEMENGKAEAIYLKRLFRFLGFIKEEIIYFIVQEDIHILHTCSNEIH